VILLLLPVAIGSYLLFTHVQTGFFPEFDEGAFVIDYKMPAGTSLAETDHVSRQIEGLLAKTPEVAGWSRLTGALSGSGLELVAQSQGDILVRLKDKRERAADEVMADLRGQIGASLPAMQIDFAQMLQDSIGDMAGSPAPVEVKIFGDDPATLARLAHQAGDIVNKTPGVVDENDGVVQSGPQVSVRVDSQRASRFGLTTDAVTAAATAALNGTVATTVQQGEEGIDVRVEAAHAPGDITPDSLQNVPIAAPSLAGGTAAASPGGGTVPLGTVAELSPEPGTPLINRENQQHRVAVTARLEGRDLGSAVKDVQARLARDLPLPPGYRIEYGGLYASQQDSFGQLAVVLVLAICLVSTLLIIQFRSFRQAFALFAAAILSLFGVLLGLFVTKTPLNISSFTGAIMIVGIVTENGIVLFDFFNHQRRAGPARGRIDGRVGTDAPSAHPDDDGGGHPGAVAAGAGTGGGGGHAAAPGSGGDRGPVRLDAVHTGRRAGAVRVPGAHARPAGPADERHGGRLRSHREGTGSRVAVLQATWRISCLMTCCSRSPACSACSAWRC